MKKIILISAVVALSILVFVFYEELLSALNKLDALSADMPVFVAFVLIALKGVSAPLGVPGTPLTLLTGSIFSPVLGTMIALVGNTLGATLAFLLSRYVFMDYVQEKLLPKYKKIRDYEERMECHALATVIVLRLIPLFPFNALNFLLGVTKIPLKQYVLGSFIGMIPGTFAFVYLGGSLRAFSSFNIGLSVAGIIALVYSGKLYERKILEPSFEKQKRNASRQL